MPKSLPSRPNLEQLKKQAKDLLKETKAGLPAGIQRFIQHHPQAAQKGEAALHVASFSLSDAQLVVAREYGFASWAQLKEEVESLISQTDDSMALLKKAFTADDAPGFRRLLKRRSKPPTMPIAPKLATRISKPCAQAWSIS